MLWLNSVTCKKIFSTQARTRIKYDPLPHRSKCNPHPPGKCEYLQPVRVNLLHTGLFRLPSIWPCVAIAGYLALDLG